MSKWIFEDGTVLASRGHVRGPGRAADELRARIADPHYRQTLFGHRSRGKKLVLSSDYMLNALALDVATDLGMVLTTGYVPHFGDAPSELAATLHAHHDAMRVTSFRKVF
jgi:hypothetical protein